MKQESFQISNETETARLDVFLADRYPNLSRSYFQHLINQGSVLVNDQSVKSSYKLKRGDEVEITFVETSSMPLPEGEPIPLDIIYEDKDVIVLNKQSSLVAHPAAGNLQGTLVNALIHHFPRIKTAVIDSGQEVSLSRPGLVQRLDKDTSGVMIVAKNQASLFFLTKKIRERQTKKIYWAICYGWPRDEAGELVNFLGRHPVNRKKMADVGKEKGREAVSDYTVLDYFVDHKNNKACLIQFDIKTGRTHQIRFQAGYFGHPVLGDPVYNNRQSLRYSQTLGIKRQMLHAKKLKIKLPDGQEREFEAPLPQDFSQTLSKMQRVDMTSERT